MNRAQPRLGFSGPPGDWTRRFFIPGPFRRDDSGFTLLEMIIVFVIIAILAALSLPAMQSAFTEQAVRKDTQQFALMVKMAMNQAAEQHRPYVIDLTAGSAALHPLGVTLIATPDAANTASFDDAATTTNNGPADVDVTTDFDDANKLQTPDPIKANAWIDMPVATQWIFQPGELCPATRVRMSRGAAWVEMSFNALTGDVENETYNLP